MTSKRVLPNSMPELTGLRGIAIIMVVIYHGAWPRAVGASLGVDIFFVLSGFLITSLLVREAQSAGSISLKNFYMRRVLRLLPALILMLVGITLYSLFFMSAEMFRHTFLDAIAAIFYSTNWIRAFSLNDSILGHTWSLSIEEQFYILWPAIFIFVTRRRSSRLRFVLIAILVLAPLFLRALMQHNGVSPFRIYNGLDTRADDLMVGCFLSFLFFGDRSEPGQTATWCRLLKPAATAAFIVLVFMCAFADQLNPSYNYFGYTLVQVCCGL